ncbi:DUF5658 family protein [Desulfosporosinus lacus]|uniref:DUF5658 family protein n=1 Tax=Desulfosporosinus lacus TaxID=329936 RepID=UPI00093559F3
MFFCALNALDYITTMLAISHGAVEGNPIADYFVGNNALHYFKLVSVGLLCIFLIHMAKRNLKNQQSVIRVLWATNLLFGLICIYNVVAYFIQKYDFALR